MNVDQVRVQNYKSIQDSEFVDIDDVVALVGPNEAGKTAFLQALTKFNPLRSSGTFDVTQEYPRRELSMYRDRHDHDPDPVVTLKIELESEDIDLLESQFGADIVLSRSIEVTKYYNQYYEWDIDIDESAFINNILDKFDIHHRTEESLRELDNIEEFVDEVRDSTSDSKEFPELRDRVSEVFEGNLENHIGEAVLEDRLPKFVYFDEYYIMEGKVRLDELSSKSESEYTKGEETFVSFLSLAGFDPNEIVSLDDFEDVIAELEAVSNRLTEQVFEYWSQGPSLRVKVRDHVEVDDRGNEIIELQVRIENSRHRNTLPFGERSRGFIWFFSFLAYFSDISDTMGDDLILLLDEPGLNLHAKAQNDLLRFIDEELAPDHTVLYTTHSPFMLDPTKLHRARLVEDKDDDETDEMLGTKISEDIIQFGSDTQFPLQAALGYDVIQTLVIGPEILLVEGPSDLTYLQILSELLNEQGRSSLDHRWTVIPIGGADKASTFVSLFGGQGLNTAVLLDGDKNIENRLGGVIDRGLIDRESILSISEYTEHQADIEDLFPEGFYIQLVQDAYRSEFRFNDDVRGIDLDSMDYAHPRITKRVEHFFDNWDINRGEFDHSEPANHLQRFTEEYEEEIPEELLDNFEELIDDINSLL